MRCSHVEKGKKMDNLAKCAFLAKKAGMSYGNWMAIYGEKIIVKKEAKIPAGWKLCEGCKKPFRGKPNQRFCEPQCRNEVYQKKYLESHKEHLREYRRNWREARKKLNA